MLKSCTVCIPVLCCLLVSFLSFHESKLLTEAAKLQLKAAKTDILFKMLDSFNKNSIQVTTRWTLLDNMLGIFSPHSLIIERNPTSHTLPSLFTIIKKFPTILFTLENNSDFEESSKTGKISTLSLISFIQPSPLWTLELLKTKPPSALALPSWTTQSDDLQMWRWSKNGPNPTLVTKTSVEQIRRNSLDFWNVEKS